MGNKIVIVKVAELDTNLFVRKSLDQDRVLVLAELVQNGTKLPAILISQNKKVIDGRHRVECYDLCGVLEIEAEMVDVSDEGELIAMAFKANMGGPMPPTTDDIEHTVLVMLEHKIAQKRIVEILGLPPEMTKKYIKDVQSRLVRQKIQQAADAVAYDGLTVIKAAEQFSVNPDRLKEILSGNRKKQKIEAFTEVTRNLTKKYRSLGSSNASALRRLFEKFQDGDVSKQQVDTIFDKIDKLQKQSARSVADWKKRFASVNGNGSVG